MIKVLEFFHRRADLDQAAFIHHWQTAHTDVVLGLPGVCRYVQNPVVHALTPAPIFDGVVELWFPSLEVMRVNGKSTYWPVVVADEERFIDRTTTALLLVEDPTPPPILTGLKVFTLVQRPTKLPEAAFRVAMTRLAEDLSASVDFPMLRRHAACIADAVLASPCRNEADVHSTLGLGAWTRQDLRVVGQLVTAVHPILI